MKFLQINGLKLSREARVGSVTAIIAAIALIAFAAGWHVSGAILLLAAAALAGAFYALVTRPARIPKDAVLTIKIGDDMREDAPRSPLAQIRGRGAATLYDLRRALEAAAADVKIAGVIVEISAPSIGLATAQELHDLLRAIVAAKKRVVAVLAGDNVTVRDYLVACGAGEVVINPDTAMMMLGASAGGFFLSGALKKIGVEAQTLQWKEYKGAAEMFSRESMSAELRESLEAIVGDWKTVIAGHLAAARGIEPERARELIGQGFVSARTACAAGLADRAGYGEEVRAEFDPEGKAKPFIGLGRFLRHTSYVREGGPRARIALIHGLGPVVTGDGMMPGEFLSGERTANEIRHAANDDEVRAIVFRVNSPGGSAVGSDLVWRAVREAQKRGKPVVVSMGDVAGSGGYYVAMGADAIVAEPATITGSIGVVYTKFALPALLGQLGVAIDVAKTDEISDAMSITRPMSVGELAQLNDVVGELYGNFTAKVAEGRKLEAARAEELARGRVWSGVAAHARGLVDELGGVGRAVAIARAKAGIEATQAHDLVRYPAPNLLSAINFVMSRTDVSSDLSWLGAVGAAASGIPARWMPALIGLVARGGLMLICPLIG
ncbi:MAG: signal peptide peptidase SppA [Candidatus Binataceae bacterium]|nr:signal peptide peptidase SppA [Candidatus Binataceae bacterium]